MIDILMALRMIFGSIFVLFVPGLIWSFVFFDNKEIDWIERIALSFGLSIALVPLTVFYLNYLFSVPINLVNATITVVGICAVGGVLYKLKEEGKFEDLNRKLRKKFGRD